MYVYYWEFKLKYWLTEMVEKEVACRGFERVVWTAARMVTVVAWEAMAVVVPQSSGYNADRSSSSCVRPGRSGCSDHCSRCGVP